MVNQCTDFLATNCKAIKDYSLPELRYAEETILTLVTCPA